MFNLKITNTPIKSYQILCFGANFGLTQQLMYVLKTKISLSYANVLHE